MGFAVDLTNQNTVNMVVGISGAFFGFLGVVVSGIVAVFLAKIAAQQKKDAETQKVVAGEVKEVKSTLATAHSEQRENSAKHVEELAKLANEMNGMKDELVKVTGEAKFAEGVKSAKDEAAQEKQP